MKRDNTKFKVGQIYLKDTCEDGIIMYYLLLSWDYEKEIHDSYVWTAATFLKLSDGFKGAYETPLYEEDIDKKKLIGYLPDMIKAKTVKIVEAVPPKIYEEEYDG